jgi:MOSC domain-containing protein YiiM
MGTGRVVSVNAGRAADAAWAGRLKRTAIDKQPVTGPVAVSRLGLAGDEQADTENHGGADQAVYVYAREDLGWWAHRLGRDLRDGMFGENITSQGIEVTGALMGERWRLGSAIAEVTTPRIPCSVFRGWMAERGWVKEFALARRPGAYLRVIEPGVVCAGDEIEVVARPAGGVTMAEAMHAYYTRDAGVTGRILQVPGHAAKWDAFADEMLSAARTAAQAG